MTDSIWQVEVDQASDAEWSQMLDLFNDGNVYQTAAYGRVHWGARSLSRLVLKRNGEVAGMAQLRIIRPTPLKFGMAYLRWGPLWERRGNSVDPEVAIRLARAIEDEYVKARTLFVRILPNAFDSTERAAVFNSAFSNFTSEAQEPGDIYRTIVLNLSPTLEELRKRLDKKWRNQLTRSEKNDLTVVSGDGDREFGVFCEMYSQMRKRKTFETTVDDAEFRQMQEALPASQRMRVLICQEKGIPVAGIVTSAMGDSAVYLLGATSDAGLSAKGSYLLQWTMISWLKERGIRFYDLGGIDPGGNPGVYHFKKGFSGEDVRQILPVTGSRSAVSWGMVKLGITVQRALRVSLKPFNAARSLKQNAAAS
jgi:lipid II:glycine glycyltransferase (peptidoglycan interpeptide bridge formation enzyme)